MSQQINLYNPDLKKQRDWISFPSLVGGFSFSVIAIFCAWLYASGDIRSLEASRRTSEGQLKALQARAQAVAQALAGRKSDPSIAKEAETLAAAFDRRQEALKMMQAGAGKMGAVAGYMRGFARQTSEGVWLTGFKIAEGQLEIHGRLLDASLLPPYIRRLNSEPAFRGHRFVALDIKGWDPESEKGKGVGGGGNGQPNPPSGLKYMDFALLSSISQPVSGAGAGN